MPVRIEHESAIIIWVIQRARSGGTIVATTRYESGGVERVDQFPAFGANRDVKLTARCVLLRDPEPRSYVTVTCEFGNLAGAYQAADAQWSERGIVEGA